MFLQTQLLAEIVISFFILLLADLDEVGVILEAFLRLLDFLCRAVLRVFRQDGPQRGHRADIF